MAIARGSLESNAGVNREALTILRPEMDTAAQTTVLFGQADTLRNSMNEQFRRLDNVGKRAKRAFKATGEQTLRACLDAHTSAVEDEPPLPPTWRDEWLA